MAVVRVVVLSLLVIERALVSPGLRAVGGASDRQRDYWEMTFA